MIFLDYSVFSVRSCCIGSSAESKYSSKFDGLPSSHLSNPVWISSSISVPGCVWRTGFDSSECTRIYNSGTANCSITLKFAVVLHRSKVEHNFLPFGLHLSRSSTAAYTSFWQGADLSTSCIRPARLINVQNCTSITFNSIYELFLIIQWIWLKST